MAKSWYGRISSNGICTARHLLIADGYFLYISGKTSKCQHLWRHSSRIKLYCCKRVVGPERSAWSRSVQKQLFRPAEGVHWISTIVVFIGNFSGSGRQEEEFLSVEESGLHQHHLQVQQVCSQQVGLVWGGRPIQHLHIRWNATGKTRIYCCIHLCKINMQLLSSSIPKQWGLCRTDLGIPNLDSVWQRQGCHWASRKSKAFIAITW